MTGAVLRETRGDADRARLTALAHTIWREHYPTIIGSAQVEYMLRRRYGLAQLAAEQAAGTRFVLAWRGDDPIAFAALARDVDRPDRRWLDKLYVRADARGHGLARRLVDWALARAVDDGAATLWLRVNRHNAIAIAAYRRLGFEIEQADRLAIGDGFVMDDYLMRRALAAIGQPPPAP